MVNELLPLAAKIAREFSNIPGLPHAEIEIVAREALANAARHFDPAKGDFTAYAARAMRNALRDLYERQVRHHRHHLYDLDLPITESATTPDSRVQLVVAPEFPLGPAAPPRWSPENASKWRWCPSRPVSVLWPKASATGNSYSFPKPVSDVREEENRGLREGSGLHAGLEQPPRYRVLMKLMVEGWRDGFKDPKLPVGVIGCCAGGNTQNEDNFESESFAGAPFIREAQSLGLADVRDPVNTAFLPAYHVQVPGLHPSKKRDHGERATRWALAKIYARKGIRWDSAALVSADPQGDEMILTFSQKVLPADMNSIPRRFSSAGENGKFYMAHARYRSTRDGSRWKIDPTIIHVWSPLVNKPVAVRYAWVTSPMGNLKTPARSRFRSRTSAPTLGTGRKARIPMSAWWIAPRESPSRRKRRHAATTAAPRRPSAASRSLIGSRFSDRTKK